MPTIQIDNEVYECLEKRIEKFGEGPNEVIRRILSLNASPSPRRPEASVEATPPLKGEEDLLKLISSPKYELGNGKERYFAILAFLYRKNPNDFSKLEGLSRGSRVNISRDATKIENSGNSTNPQRLEGTPYFVMANLDNKSKREILDSILKMFGFSQTTRTVVENSIPDSGISRPKRYY